MTNTGTPSVVLYTTPTCPDCHAVKRWLADQGVPFEERDLSDPQIAEEAKAVSYTHLTLPTIYSV